MVTVMSGTIYRNYCVHCDWEVTIEEHSREELSALAIEHACEHGHDIDSQSMVEVDRSSSPTTYGYDERPEQESSS